MTHDKFCPWFNGWPEASSCLFCDSLAKARADERERLAPTGPKGFTTLNTGIMPWIGRLGRRFVTAPRGGEQA